MNSTNTGLWPTVAAPSSESRARAQRIALAQAKASPDPHQRRPSESPITRFLQALRTPPDRIGRAAA
jgi:hypothetical protein